jgi:hypothetical protein
MDARLAGALARADIADAIAAEPSQVPLFADLQIGSWLADQFEPVAEWASLCQRTRALGENALSFWGGAEWSWVAGAVVLSVAVELARQSREQGGHVPGAICGWQDVTAPSGLV